MAGEAQDIDAVPLHINGKDPRRLGGVHDKQRPRPAAHSADPADIRQIAGQIGGVGDDHGPRAGRNLPLQGRVVEAAANALTGFGLRPHDRQLHAHFLHLVERAQHAVVLQHRGHGAVARPQDSFNRSVQGLRRVGGEGHLLRARGPEKLCQKLPGLIDDAAAFQSRAVGAAGIVSQMPHGPEDGLSHLRRAVKGGGRIVKINHRTLLWAHQKLRARHPLHDLVHVGDRSHRQLFAETVVV